MLLIKVLGVHFFLYTAVWERLSKNVEKCMKQTPKVLWVVFRSWFLDHRICREIWESITAWTGITGLIVIFFFYLTCWNSLITGCSDYLLRLSCALSSFFFPTTFLETSCIQTSMQSTPNLSDQSERPEWIEHL